MMVQCMCCVRVTCQDINLEHETPTVFIIPQFGPRLLVLLWYGFWWMYFTTNLFVDIFVHHTEHRQLWMADLSNWCYLLTVCTLTVELTVRTLVLCCRKDILTDSMEKLPWYIKVQWVLQNIHNSTSILVCALFYTVVRSEFTFSRANKHLIISVYVITNTLILTSSPVKLLHAYQPMIFTTVYVIFTVVFQKINPTHSYTKLYNWENTFGAAILSICTVLLIIPLIHSILFCLYKLRIFLHKKCSTQNTNSTQYTHSPKQAMQRDITATDVILEENSRNYHYVDIQPEAKDDLNLKTSEEIGRTTMGHKKSRLYQSETDLRSYRMKNGFYCDFAKPSSISHFVSPRCNDKEYSNCNNNNHDDRRGSQIIVVKKCNTPTSSIKGGNSLESVSDVSSDYIEQYLEEDLIAYYL